MITATRYHDFCAGHRVVNHESKCAHLHGHNYRIYFTIKGPELDALGRVLDFSVIKAILCQWLEDNWDHKFLMFHEDPFLDSMRLMDRESIVVVPFNPTAENMAEYLVENVAPRQFRKHGYPEIHLVKCVVEETRKCSVTYEKD